MPKIVCIGEVLWDKLPKGMFLGGAPLNVAVSLKNFGLDSEIISAVGDDELGKKTIQAVREKGINTDFLQTQESPTGLVEVEVDENGIPSYDIKEPAAWDFIVWNSGVEELSMNADYIVFGSLSQRCLVSRNTIRRMLEQTQAIRIFDVNLRPPYDDREVVKATLYLSNIVKINDEELRIISGWHEQVFDEKEGIRFLQEKYNLNGIIITKGSKGAIFFDGKKFYEHPGFEVKVKDTVGAGDAFLAAFIYGMISEKSPEQILEFANKVGAFVASRNGATPDLDKDWIQNNL